MRIRAAVLAIGLAIAALTVTLPPSVSTAAPPCASGGARTLEKLHATSTQPFVGSGGPVTLSGPNLQPIWDAQSAATWPQETYTSIRAKGFNAVRMVLFWKDFQPTEAAWNETAFCTLSTAVDYAATAGLYVILDSIHLSGDSGMNGPDSHDGKGHFPAWTLNGPNQRLEAFEQAVADGLGFLQTLATRYANDPAIAAFDPINEPYHDPRDPNGLLSGYSKIIDAIRAKDPNTSIVLEPSYGDAKVPASAFAALTPGSKKNLIWSIHDYYPGGAGAGYNPNGTATTPNASSDEADFPGYNPANKPDLATHLQVQLDLTRDVGLPLWIGEFGIAANKPGHDQFIKDYVALFKSKSLGYSWWEYKDNGSFSMIDPNNNDRWLPWVDLLLPR
ncbi:glycoside hydrolase family 5 protein [Nocardia iowensis]|uniref:Glycoside hydrolase family 5 protein n=1 Tax=Nocardia iowensis TaxID=204891 RepID=A0ABX8RXA8_NOCIO|nr:cellulase family glycosylhydrolase [Nocardia iowensis]QXN94300.1 glycoside hydrolase family 5 protein [Nocardia iowensis]